MASMARRPFLEMVNALHLKRKNAVLGTYDQHGPREHAHLDLLEFLKFAFCLLLTEIGHTTSVATEEAIVIDGTDGEEDLGPSQCRNGIKGGNTVGD